MQISQELYKELRKLTRAAQRRMERASAGQRSYLEFIVEQKTGAKKWSSAAKDMTTQQANAQIRKLKDFLNAPTSSRKGWESTKKSNVAKANATFGSRRQGHDITDEEMAEILKQLGDPDRKSFYHAVNKVQAMKGYMGDSWKGTPDDIALALKQKWSAQDAYKRALEERKANLRGAAGNEGADIPY